MRRPVVVLALSLLTLVLQPGTAFAHASFDLEEVPAGSEQELTLRVPIERDAGNDRIAVRVPAGFEVTACAGAEGWDCTTEASDDATVVSLVRSDGGDATTERFGLTLLAPAEEGVATFPVVQTYDDGEEVAWVNEPGSDRPAPQLRVTGSTGEVEPAGPPTHGGTDPGATAAPPSETGADDTAAPTDDTTSEPDPNPTEDAGLGDDSTAPPPEEGDDSGILLVLIGAVVVLAAVVAGVVVRRRSEQP